MDIRVVIVTHSQWLTDNGWKGSEGKTLQQRVEEVITDLVREGWQIRSARTEVSTTGFSSFHGTPSESREKPRTEYVATLVMERARQ